MLTPVNQVLINLNEKIRNQIEELHGILNELNELKYGKDFILIDMTKHEEKLPGQD